MAGNIQCEQRRPFWEGCKQRGAVETDVATTGCGVRSCGCILVHAWSSVRSLSLSLFVHLWCLSPSLRLVYRDIKQENIAFDVRGDVKVFDFGLSKGLSKELQSARRNEYNLTPRTGSLPYMAPEIAECKPYGTKCDVFSFGMLLWEMMALKDAYPRISARQYMERLVMKDERPQINKHWTPLVRTLIKEAWGKDPETRPEMRRIATMLRADLKDITDDDSIVNRTTHMASRSKHSIRLYQRGLQLG